MKHFYLILTATLITWPLQAQENTWAHYQTILDAGIVKLNFVGPLGNFKHNAFNYEKIHHDKSIKKEILKQKQILNKLTPPTNRYQKLAFWINAYNFFTLVDVLENYPITSMKKLGWKKRHHMVDQSSYSLDDIEHKIIRPMSDPRIHFAVNCASVSCPGLRDEAFTGNNIRQELNEQTVEAFKNPLHLKIQDSELYATKLFDWFKEDFQSTYKSSELFIKKYAHQSLHLHIEEWIDYNWLLNNPKNIQKALSVLNIKQKK